MRRIAALILFCLYLPAQERRTGPLTIEEAVREAIDHNLDILVDKFNLSIADARIITAKLRPNPVLTVGADHLDVLGTGYNDVNTAGPSEYSIRTDFVLERGQKRTSRVAVAQGVRAVVELQALNSIRNLILDVQNAYAEALLAKDSLALAQDNLASFGEIVVVNRKRVNIGDLSEVELLRTELAQLQYESAVRQANLRVRTALTKLQLLLGRTNAASLVEVTGTLRRERGKIDAEELVKTALESRPDLRSVQRDQVRSAAEVRLQIAQGKIDYTVGTEYRRQQGLAGTGSSLGVFFSTNIPVFNKNQGEIERATQEQRQVAARIKALAATIQTEVETAYLQYANAQAGLDRLEGSMLLKARDVRQIMDFSYKKGEATLVELLDAQRAYNETMQAYNEARFDFARSLFLLDAATGKTVIR